MRTFAPGFGMQVVEVPHEGGAIDPSALRAAAEGAACAIFAQPNFFGVLEDAPALAAAAKEAGALAVAHVDLTTLGVLEAPGAYGCDLAIGEGQAAGNSLSYGGPHYGFLAARMALARQLPGRIVGETVDRTGQRAYVLTLQTREQHIRRERATSNITSNQTLLALGGLAYLSWLGPQGLRELGERCLALAEHAKGRLGLPLAFAQPTLKEFVVRTGRPAGEVIAACKQRGVHPGYAIGRDYPGLDDCLMVALTEKRTTADIDRLAGVWTRCCTGRRHEADLREVAGGAARGIAARSRRGARERARPPATRGAAAAAGDGRARDRPPLHRRSRPATSASTRTSTRSARAR